MNTILVQSADGRAFWERDERHPDGEVFVANEAAVEVAETTEVKKALKVGRLKLAEAKKAEPKSEPKAEVKVKK